MGQNGILNPVADEIRKQIAKDYPEDWLRGFEFYCFPTDEQLKAHLFRTIEESSPRRVLVVGGMHLFETLRNEDLSAFDICVNTINDLGWLCEFCKYVRNNQTPSIVVSNFPREHAPPLVRFVAGPDIVAKLGGPIGGTVYETAAPPEASVALCEESDQSTMSVFFYGVHALSYYDAVLQSQRRRPDQLLTCTVMSTHDNPNLLVKDQLTLKSSRDLAEHRRILIGASETWERFARFYDADRYRESTAYSGGILAGYRMPEKIPSRPRFL